MAGICSKHQGHQIGCELCEAGMTKDNDLKDAQEEWSNMFPLYKLVTPDIWKDEGWLCFKKGFVKGRRTLREKIKADPSIGKLMVEGEWPD